MSGAGDNYEAVDMEESDESGSDNEAFATKQEYKAYKEQFKVSKVLMAQIITEYGSYSNVTQTIITIYITQSFFLGTNCWIWRK